VLSESLQAISRTTGLPRRDRLASQWCWRRQPTVPGIRKLIKRINEGIRDGVVLDVVADDEPGSSRRTWCATAYAGNLPPVVQSFSFASHHARALYAGGHFGGNLDATASKKEFLEGRLVGEPLRRV
jgi:hypothetical protein